MSTPKTAIIIPDTVPVQWHSQQSQSLETHTFGGLTLSLIPSPATNKESYCTREGVFPVLDLKSIETEAIAATAQLVQPSCTGSLAKLSNATFQQQQHHRDKVV